MNDDVARLNIDNNYSKLVGKLLFPVHMTSPHHAFQKNATSCKLSTIPFLDVINHLEADLSKNTSSHVIGRSISIYLQSFVSIISRYSLLPITRTFGGNRIKFELSEVSVIEGKIIL